MSQTKANKRPQQIDAHDFNENLTHIDQTP